MKSSTLSFQSAPDTASGAELNLVEHEFHRVVDEIKERIVHHCDRPEIEVRILAFLDHALGPSTEGIAAEMGISPAAAAVHLQALFEANRIWGQPVHGNAMAWHISQEGRHFLTERGAGTTNL